MLTRVAAFILAGGRGHRMGRPDKGMLRFASGRTILAHLLEELQAAGISRAILVTDDPKPYEAFGMTTIADLRKDKGPLGGMEAALDHLRTTGIGEAALFLPCDTPALTSRELSRLLAAFHADPQGVKVASVAGSLRLHALCCVVHAEVLPSIQEAIAESRLRVNGLWRRLGAQVVLFQDERPFRNVNTPEEWASWLSETRP